MTIENNNANTLVNYPPKPESTETISHEEKYKTMSFQDRYDEGLKALEKVSKEYRALGESNAEFDDALEKLKKDLNNFSSDEKKAEMVEKFIYDLENRDNFGDLLKSLKENEDEKDTKEAENIRRRLNGEKSEDEEKIENIRHGIRVKMSKMNIFQLVYFHEEYDKLNPENEANEKEKIELMRIKKIFKQEYKRRWNEVMNNNSNETDIEKKRRIFNIALEKEFNNIKTADDLKELKYDDEEKYFFKELAAKKLLEIKKETEPEEERVKEAKERIREDLLKIDNIKDLDEARNEFIKKVMDSSISDLDKAARGKIFEGEYLKRKNEIELKGIQNNSVAKLDSKVVDDIWAIDNIEDLLKYKDAYEAKNIILKTGTPKGSQSPEMAIRKTFLKTIKKRYKEIEYLGKQGTYKDVNKKISEDIKKEISGIYSIEELDRIKEKYKRNYPDIAEGDTALEMSIFNDEYEKRKKAIDSLNNKDEVIIDSLNINQKQQELYDKKNNQGVVLEKMQDLRSKKEALRIEITAEKNKNPVDIEVLGKLNKEYDRISTRLEIELSDRKLFGDITGAEYQTVKDAVDVVDKKYEDEKKGVLDKLIESKIDNVEKELIENVKTMGVDELMQFYYKSLESVNEEIEEFSEKYKYDFSSEKRRDLAEKMQNFFDREIYKKVTEDDSLGYMEKKKLQWKLKGMKILKNVDEKFGINSGKTIGIAGKFASKMSKIMIGGGAAVGAIAGIVWLGSLLAPWAFVFKGFGDAYRDAKKASGK